MRTVIYIHTRTINNRRASTARTSNHDFPYAIYLEYEMFRLSRHDSQTAAHPTGDLGFTFDPGLHDSDQLGALENVDVVFLGAAVSGGQQLFTFSAHPPQMYFVLCLRATENARHDGVQFRSAVSRSQRRGGGGRGGGRGRGRGRGGGVERTPAALPTARRRGQFLVSPRATDQREIRVQRSKVQRSVAGDPVTRAAIRLTTHVDVRHAREDVVAYSGVHVVVVGEQTVGGQVAAALGAGQAGRGVEVEALTVGVGQYAGRAGDTIGENAAGTSVVDAGLCYSVQCPVAGQRVRAVRKNGEQQSRRGE